MTQHLLRLAVAVVAIAVGGSELSAQDLFKETHKDLGGAPRGAILTHSFTLTNSTASTLHVASLRTSCGNCTSATMARSSIDPGETASVLVTVDTNKYAGSRTFTVYVLFDQPVVREVRLTIAAISREDLSMQPSQIAFGRVRKGAAPSASVTIQRYGDGNWQITSIDNENGYLQPQIENVTQFPNQPAYRLAVKLRPDIPPGNWHSDIWLKTNDVATPRIRVPLTVEVESSLTATPGDLAFGRVRSGGAAEKKVVIRGAAPFKIARIEGSDELLEISGGDAEAKTVQVLTVRLSPNNKSGSFQRRIRVHTDLEEEKTVEFTVQGQVSP